MEEDFQTDEEATEEPAERSVEEYEEPGGSPGEEHEENRFEGAARQALRWAAILGLAFVLGIAALWIARLRPQQERVRSMETEVRQAQTQIGDLESEVTELESLRQENQELRQDLELASLHLDLLDILVDVEAAQIALEQDNPSRAQSALRGTDAKLEELGSGLEGSPADSVQAMRDRLRLVMEELNSDAFAARQDLEIMANSLLSLEEVLFGSE